jgi:hypothetical protein
VIAGCRDHPSARVHVVDLSRRPLITVRKCQQSILKRCSLSQLLVKTVAVAATARITTPKLVLVMACAKVQVPVSIEHMAMSALAIPRFDKSCIFRGMLPPRHTL